MAKHPKSDLKSQLKELWLTEMLKPMFPNLNPPAAITHLIPVSLACLEIFFSKEGNKDKVT